MFTPAFYLKPTSLTTLHFACPPPGASRCRDWAGTVVRAASSAGISGAPPPRACSACHCTQTMPTRTDYVSTQTGVQAGVGRPARSWSGSRLEVHRLYGTALRRTTFRPISRPSNAARSGRRRHFGWRRVPTSSRGRWRPRARGPSRTPTPSGQVSRAPTHRRLAVGSRDDLPGADAPDAHMLLTAERDPRSTRSRRAPAPSGPCTRRRSARGRTPSPRPHAALLQVGYSVRTTLARLRHGGRPGHRRHREPPRQASWARARSKPDHRVSLRRREDVEEGHGPPPPQRHVVVEFTAPKRMHASQRQRWTAWANRVTQRVVRALPGCAVTDGGGDPGARPTAPAEIPGNGVLAAAALILTGTPSTSGEVNDASAVGPRRVRGRRSTATSSSRGRRGARRGRRSPRTQRRRRHADPRAGSSASGWPGARPDPDRTARYSAAPRRGPQVRCCASAATRSTPPNSTWPSSPTHRTATMGRTPSDVVRSSPTSTPYATGSRRSSAARSARCARMMVPNLTVVPHAENVAAGRFMTLLRRALPRDPRPIPRSAGPASSPRSCARHRQGRADPRGRPRAGER